MEKTFGEMEAWARSVFGDTASVSCDNGEWNVSTGIKERFSWEGLEETPAYAANERDEENYGSEFARWCAKNGQWGSMRESVELYNSQAEEELQEYCAMLDRWADEEGIMGKTHDELQDDFNMSFNIESSEYRDKAFDD